MTADAHTPENGTPWRLTDEDRVLYSETIPGHLWNAVRRMCECGAEVGVACDRETVEQHLDAAAASVIPPVKGDA